MRKSLLLLIGATIVAASGLAQPVSAAVPATSELVVAVNEILSLVEAKKWKQVSDRVAPLREKYPDTPELPLFAAAAEHGLKHPEKCETLAREFLGRFPNSANRDQALYLLGASLLQNRKTAEASQILKEASSTTSDPTLRERIQLLEKASQLSQRIGIRLGGKPPNGAEEIARACAVAWRILEMAVRDYRGIHGRDPERLDDLLAGDPPILRSLPENPESPGEALPLGSVEGAKP